MTRPFDKHLDSDELDGLVSSHAAGVTESGRLSEKALREAQRHVESCQDCSRKVQMHKSVQSEILRMGVQTNVGPGPHCFADIEWLNLAAGLLPEARTKELMKHAAQCGHCGPLLKNAVETFADEATPDEEALLASLKSARPEWHRNMAATLRGGDPEGPQKAPWLWAAFRWPSPAFVFAAIAAVAIVSGIALRTLRPPTAEQLLARAYTERRTLEVRIPGAKYAPMRVERSAGGSNLDKSPSLLKAEALIGENLSQHPNDPQWLQARARADLLDGNYESAIKSLNRALEAEPDSPQLLTDLGSAYFLRAESADRAIDYGSAIESLGKALAKSPDDPVALFNRALACERMFLYTQALDDWKHYLRVEPSGEWADDARRRQAALLEKMKRHELSQSAPLLSPARFTETLRGSDESAKVAVDQRVEDYLNIALIKWLPAAFPSAVSPVLPDDRTSAKDALRVLARLQSERHSDRWLADLLERTPSVSLAPALDKLSKARQADDDGDPTAARVYAEQAALLFSLESNEPGAKRAKLEEAYALQRSANADRCLQVLTPLRASLRGYSWMEGQALLEGMACSGMVGDLLSSQRDAEAAIVATERSRYDALHLRSLAFTASLATEKGDDVNSWARNLAGIQKYWSGPYPPIRGYQFYADLADDEERQGRGQVARILWIEATAAIALTTNRSGEAMSRYRLATVSVMIGDTVAAEEEFRKASQLFGGLPQDPSTQTYEMDSDVALASLLADRGDVDDAMQKLNAVRTQLDKVTDYHIAIDFHSAMGKVYLQKSDYGQAANAFWAAIRVAEWSAKSLQTDSDRLAWDRETGAAYRELVKTYSLQRRDPIETLELWEWYRAFSLRLPPGGRNLESMKLPPATTAKVHSVDRDDLAADVVPARLANDLALVKNETVLAFDVQSDGVNVWDFDDRGVRGTWVPVPSQDLATVANRFAAECANPDSDVTALKRDARQLYQWLILPVETHLSEGRTLVIESDGPIDDIALPALTDSEGRYFGSRYAIVWSPGFWQQQQLRQDKPFDVSNHALVVGAPTAPQQAASWLPPLPDAAREAESVASRFRNARLLTGSQATLAQVEIELPSAEVFHFAGHAVSGDEPSGLLLATEEGSEPQTRTSLPLLNAAHLDTRLLKQCRLAVLSACRTSRSNRPGVTDANGLVRAFLRAKVPHIVATRWNVDSATSSVLVNAFYSEMLSGRSVSQAAQLAALQVMNNPQTSHPYYWAAFSTFGRH